MGDSADTGTWAEGFLSRGWRDFWNWPTAAIGTSTTVLTAAFQAFRGDTAWDAALVAAVVTTVGMLAWHLARAPFRQRNEARDARATLDARVKIGEPIQRHLWWIEQLLGEQPSTDAAYTAWESRAGACDHAAVNMLGPDLDLIIEGLADQVATYDLELVTNGGPAVNTKHRGWRRKLIKLRNRLKRILSEQDAE